MASDAIAQNAEGVKTAVRIPPVPPTISASSSEEYREACARSNSRASLRDPLNRHFEAEKLPPLIDEEHFEDAFGHTQPTSEALLKRIVNMTLGDMQQAIYKASLNRLNTREPGSFVAEAGSFAAVTCWEPRYASPEALDHGNGLQANPARNFADRPLFTLFNARIEAAKFEHLYPILWKHALEALPTYLSQPTCPFTRTALKLRDPASDPRLMYWKLCMTSRDPAVQPPVPGAVRAVIEPYVKRWVNEDGMPAVWLEAGGPRARDVYAWLGFRVVDEIAIGRDENDQPVSTWCMIYTKDCYGQPTST